MSLPGIEHAPPLIKCGRSTSGPWKIAYFKSQWLGSRKTEDAETIEDTLGTFRTFWGLLDIVVWCLHYGRRICLGLNTRPLWQETSPPLLYTTTLHNSTREHKTTNVPVVFIAWYIMILRGATPWCCTPQKNHYVPRHKNNRYINSYKFHSKKQSIASAVTSYHLQT
jgi:hypothetical protein